MVVPRCPFGQAKRTRPCTRKGMDDYWPSWPSKLLLESTPSLEPRHARDRAAAPFSSTAGPIQRGIILRTFVVGTTIIDVAAHISREDLEFDRLVLRRFEGSEALANAAFQTLVDRYRDKPLAEYAMAPQEVELKLSR
jgi:hypothetical protein